MTKETITEGHRDMCWQFCEAVQKNHTPAHKQEVKEKLHSYSNSEQQMLQWIQDFNYKLLNADANH